MAPGLGLGMSPVRLSSQSAQSIASRLATSAHRPAGDSYINLFPPDSLSIFFFSSPALFAFWLRSSVVSVLFSLISESVLRNTTLINLIFGFRGRASVLAHVLPHCVIGLTLPSIDANFFINADGLLSGWRGGYVNCRIECVVNIEELNRRNEGHVYLPISDV